MRTIAFGLLILLGGCSAQVSTDAESCSAHDYYQFAHGEFACDQATAPACGFGLTQQHAEAADITVNCLCGANGTYGCSAVVDVCHSAPAPDFVSGLVSCNPAAAQSCAFDVDNHPTGINSDPKPVSYVCDCASGGTYACFGSPGLAAHNPL